MTALDYTAYHLTMLRPELELLQPELQELSDLLQELIMEARGLSVPEEVKRAILRRLRDLEIAIAEYGFLGPEPMVEATEGMVGSYLRYETSILTADKAAPKKAEKTFSQKFFGMIEKTDKLVKVSNSIYTLVHHLGGPTGDMFNHIRGLLGS